ncbi:MAG TPA: hypothetical protein ENK19_04075, partial [Acidobacteria bacterium]|nr:hypothetical protein [Acidobacteriota bacterium]
MFKRALVIACIVFAGGMGVVAAQEIVDGRTVSPPTDQAGMTTEENAPIGVPNAYGIQNYSAYVIPPASFHAYNDSLGYVLYTSGYVAAQSTDTFRWFLAPVELPTGALLANTVIHVRDSTSAGHIHVIFSLYECPGTAGCTSTSLVDVATTDSDTPGYTVLSDTGTYGRTWRNFD